MKKEEITCDGCAADLTNTGNCDDYRIALINERIPSKGGAVTLMATYPILDSNKHFCGIGCLQRWMATAYPSRESVDKV